MGVSRCIIRAIDIAKAPRSEWKTAIAALPEACECPSVCTGGRGCRERIADYLRMQWLMLERRERIKGRKR